MTDFAYAPDPAPDEPLDGWIERIAAATLTSSWSLFREAGLLRSGRMGPNVSMIRDLRPDELTRISELTGISAPVIHQMTLHRWTSLGLVPHRSERGHQGGAWARSRIGRFCPACLDERHGIHRIHWRTVWSFACVRHQVLLHAFDPATPPYGDPIPLTPSHPLNPHHPVLVAQRTIDDLLNDPTHKVPSLGAIHSGWQYLSDLGALTRVIMSGPDFNAPDGHAAALQQRTGTDWQAISTLFPPPRASTSPAALLAQAVLSPALTALATSMAHQILEKASPTDCGDLLWWLTEPQRVGFRQRAASRAISYPLSQAVTPTAPKRAGREFLLRFVLARHDESGRRLSPLDPSKVPSSAWTTVVRRSHTTSREVQGVAASAALLMIASDRHTDNVLQALGLAHLRSRVTADWNLAFDNTPDGDADFQQLLDLQRALATMPVPIDYARRRRTFPAATPIGRNTLKQILRALNIREAALVPHCVSWYLHELLTGADFLVGRQGVDLFAAHRRIYRTWRARWQQEAPAIFYEIAERRLFVNNINEPVTWQPQLVDGSWVLPEDDGTRRLAGWETTNRPLRKTAKPAPIGSATYSLEEIVALACRGEGRKAATVHEHLRRFVIVTESPTFKAAGKSIGVTLSRVSHTIKLLEQEVGKTLFERTGTRNTLTRDGRKLKALLEKEPLFDATESTTLTPPPAEDPKGLVEYAFRNRGPDAANLREQLERYEHVVEYRSTGPAAIRIGVTPQWLGRQMASLEKQVGQPLWERTNKGISAKRLTPAGHHLHHLIQEASRTAAQPPRPTPHPDGNLE